MYGRKNIEFALTDQRFHTRGNLIFSCYLGWFLRLSDASLLSGYVYEDEWIPLESGTTATVAVYLEGSKKMLIANVGTNRSSSPFFTSWSILNIVPLMAGDSEGFILKTPEDDDDSSLVLTPITEKHNPNNIEESTLSTESRSPWHLIPCIFRLHLVIGPRLSEIGRCGFDLGEGGGYLYLRSSPYKEGKLTYEYQLSLTRSLGHECSRFMFFVCLVASHNCR